MSMYSRLLDVLCCPLTHAPLERAPRSLLHMLNRQIEQGRIEYRNGTAVTEPLQDALVTRDRRLAYAVRDGIPVLLVDEAISLVQLDIAGSQ